MYWRRRILHRNLQNGLIVYLALYRKGLLYDFDEPMVLLSQLPGSNPFVKFCRFLIQAVQMNSKECFEKLGTSYAKFLQSDQFFLFNYQNYGVKYFKKEKKESQGLLGMLQWLHKW